MNTGSEDKRCRDLFLALWISDLFMERVEKDEMWSLMCPDQCPNLNKVYGDEFKKLYEQYENEGKYVSRVPARKLFKHIMTCQSETGFPYMCYKDHANRKSNQKNLGTICSSNLCVSGDTYILTKKGQFPIKDCLDKNVNIWNGSEWSEVIVKQTGINKDLVRVSLSNGTYLDCTPEHKFYIQESYWKTTSKELPAKDLKPGNKLIKWNLPKDVECETTEFKYPYTHGFFCGDGTTVDNYSKTLKYPVLRLYGEKKLLIDHIDKTSYSDNNANNVISVTLPKDLEPKFKVPLNNNKNTQLRWLEGFFDADGSVCRNGTNESLQACSIEKDFLIEIRLMLQTLGIESKVTLSMEAKKKLLPDGNGGKKLYDCKPLWRLLINSTGLYKLSNIGFAPKRLKFVTRKPQRDCEQFVEVLSVTNLLDKQDTYCFTEPLKHMGMFNGILTGQCAEIMEYSDSNETAVCNLASLCLPRFIKYDENNKPYYDFEKLMYVSRVAIRNLNKVIELNFYPTEKTKVSNMKHSPVGLGIQGLNDIYNMMGFGFDSPEAELLNKQIFECIYYAAVDESKELAKIHGPYSSFAGSPFSEGKLQYHLWGLTEKDLLMNLDWVKLCEEVKKYGTRNSLLTALMPTASTAQIMGNYEGFEPYLTNIFVRTTLAGEFIVINEHLVKDLELLNLWNEDMRKLIIIYNGSIQHIDSIPQNIKNKYKTAFELSLKSIIKQSVERGPFIDQSQSMNLFQPKPNFKVLYTAHMYGWKNGLKTGMYYLRTSPAVNPINFGIDIDDLKRLTGLSSVEELIQNSIADANIASTKRKRNENSDSSGDNNDENNEENKKENKEEEKPIICRYVRGQAPADCLVCSS
jgi:ribonucleoside-diphosphate reductase alpha chain